jgi:hypothetical protein
LNLNELRSFLGMKKSKKTLIRFRNYKKLVSSEQINERGARDDDGNDGGKKERKIGSSDRKDGMASAFLYSLGAAVSW